jgi:hypothetical protein
VEAINKCKMMAIDEVNQYCKKVYIHDFYVSVRKRGLGCSPSQYLICDIIYNSLPKGDDNQFKNVFWRLTSYPEHSLPMMLNVRSKLIIDSLYDFCKSVNDGCMT